jgi:hypothetical protein
MLGIDPDIGHLRFWVASGAAALLVLVCALALDWTRSRIIARFAVVGFGAAFGAILAWAFLAGASGRDQSAERRNLEIRATQLTAQVLAPGSPLACLDSMAGENVEAACEKALFAAPAIVAAASSYVAARLALLSDIVAYTKAGGNLDLVLLPLRHSLEADRFGFVAHVLALHDGCTSGHCATLALLRDAERVRANLSAQPLDRYVERYMPTWGQPPDTPLAEAAPPTTAALPASQLAGPNQAGPGQKKIVIDADFPSAASIPAVSIMNPEPKASASVAADAKMRGTASARSSGRKTGNPPAQPASPPSSLSSTPGASGASLAPSSPADPVWAPGTTPLQPQSSPPNPQASAGEQ